MGRAMIEAKGHNGTVRFDGYYVTITRSGLIGRATVGRGEKRIPVSAIVAVQWKAATSLFTGFIQFETAGVGGTRSRFGRQSSDAMKDENSVVFQKWHLDAFAALRAAVEEAVARQHAAPVQAAPAAVSLSDELAKLHGLAQQGILSPQEFEAAKARLLGGPART